MVKSVSKYPPKNALNATAKYEPITGALLVSTCAVIASDHINDIDNHS